MSDARKNNASLDGCELRFIGRVFSAIKAPSLKTSSQGLSLDERMGEFRARNRAMRDLITRIVLHPELEPLLFGLTGFSHILVLYWPHLVPGRRRSLQKVHPMGCPDIPEQGIFATCSPARPNPVLVTACRLRGITGTTLEVQGLEAVDGSPVLDIKPYNPGYYRIEDPEAPEWMSSLYQRLEDDER